MSLPQKQYKAFTGLRSNAQLDADAPGVQGGICFQCTL